MSRWLDDHREVLEKDYALLKIDDVRDQNGIGVAKRVVDGEQFGIPYCAIFSANETKLITSVGPLGNVGYPNGFEGQKQLRKILLTTRQHLTDDEVEQLVKSRND